MILTWKVTNLQFDTVLYLTLQGRRRVAADQHATVLKRWDHADSPSALVEYICSILLDNSLISNHPLKHLSCWIVPDEKGNPVSCSNLDLPAPGFIRVSLYEFVGNSALAPGDPGNKLAQTLDTAIRETGCVEFFNQYIGCLLFDWLVLNGHRSLHSTAFDLCKGCSPRMVPLFGFDHSFAQLLLDPSLSLAGARRSQKCQPFGTAQIAAIQRQLPGITLIVNATKALSQLDLNSYSCFYSEETLARLSGILKAIFLPSFHLGRLIEVV